jgi:hypothetical protein
MNKIDFWKVYTFGGWSLRFKKTFHFPFIPFYNLVINDKNDFDIALENNDYTTTIIYYCIADKTWFVDITENWTKFGVSDEYVDRVLINHKEGGWGRFDNNDIDHLKTLMQDKRNQR